jgi:hypothetical protein
MGRGMRILGDVQEVLSERLFVVQAMGIMIMLRRSEHVFTKKGGRAPLSRRHLVFWDGAGREIDYVRVGVVRAEKLSINVTFSKTDHSGFGRRPAYVRQETRRDACIVCIMDEWIKSTRDGFGASEGMGVYEVPSFKDVTMEELHHEMEATVRSLSIGEYGKKASSHSLRYGGATMMAAAGFPQYLVAHYGGWTANSRSLQVYARPSDTSVQLVSEAMTRMAFNHASKHYIEDLIMRGRARK